MYKYFLFHIANVFTEEILEISFITQIRKHCQQTKKIINSVFRNKMKDTQTPLQNILNIYKTCNEEYICN